MITPDPAPFRHSHQFNEGNPLAEKNTLRAVVITAIMMVVEIVAGYALNSMALLADGWHMSSHALALGVSAGAYALARRLASDQRFAFGTWKIEVLGGYSSALLLGVVAVLMLVQSIEHLIRPAPIHYNQAIPVAVAGLLVNLLCAWLLKDGHHQGHHDHGHGHDHAHDHEHVVESLHEEAPRVYLQAIYAGFTSKGPRRDRSRTSFGRRRRVGSKEATPPRRGWRRCARGARSPSASIAG